MGTTPKTLGTTLPPPHTAIAPQTLVYPSAEEDGLWENTLHALVDQYGAERVMPEHVRQAFDTVCDNNLERMPFHDFLRKVRLAWLWQRPALARGMK